MASSLIYVVTEVVIRNDERRVFHGIEERGSRHVVVFLNKAASTQAVRAEHFVMINNTSYHAGNTNEETPKIIMTSQSKVSCNVVTN